MTGWIGFGIGFTVGGAVVAVLFGLSDVILDIARYMRRERKRHADGKRE